MFKDALLEDFDESKKRRRKYIILGGIVLLIIVIIIIIVASSGDDEKKKEKEKGSESDSGSESGTISVEPKAFCTCPTSQTVPKTIVNDPNFVPSDVIIDNKNYGKPFTIGGFIFLFQEVPVGKGTTALTDSCPKGYRLPNKTEYEQMIKNLGANAYTELHKQTGFNFQSGKKYMTGEKVSPSITDGGNADAWTFYGLSESGQTYSVQSVNSYFSSDDMVGKCVLDLTDVKINIEGTNPDLVVNSKRTLTVDKSILKGFLWRINGNLYDTASIEVLNEKRGCNTVEVWGNTMNDKQIYSCDIIYTIPSPGNLVDASFTLDKVSELSHEFPAQRVSQMYFERPQAPIAPKADGGYYLAYTDLSTNVLHVVDFDSDDKIVKDASLTYKAYPLDIIETDYGFAVYARDASDSDHSFLVTYNFDYSQRAVTTIMNNGKDPTQNKEALIFYDSNGTALYGTSIMYQPHNGKLAFGKGKLNLIFAHYNNFGESGGHTGDTYYSLEPKGDYDSAKYAWGWFSSHSLIQSHIYDGRYFITAALGDAYPQGITLAVIDVQGKSTAYDSTRKKYCNIPYTSSQELIKTFPGNFSGNSMGRLGQVLDFGSFYAVVYSIKRTDGESRDGIFLTTFKKDDNKLTLIKEAQVLGGAGRIKNIRCARYGNRILITYILNADDYGNNYPSYSQDLSETMCYLLCNTNGDVKAGPYDAKSQHQALSEDIRPLADGSLRWGYIDKNNVLRIIKVATPTK